MTNSQSVREALVAEAQAQAKIVRRTYDTDPRAYQAAETKLAKLNKRIADLDAGSAR